MFQLIGIKSDQEVVVGLELRQLNWGTGRFLDFIYGLSRAVGM